MITRVTVDAGAWVRQGQVLASVDRSVQSQEAAQLAAQIQVTRADAALAQNELDRAQALVARGFVSKADLDRKRAARDSAAARVRVAQAQLGATRARVGRLDIRAPTSGLVLARDVEVGQVVGPARAPCSLRSRRRDGDARRSRSRTSLLSGRDAGQRHGRARADTRARCGRLCAVIDPQSAQGEVRSPPLRSAIRPGGFAEAGSARVGTPPAASAKRGAQRREGNYVYIVNAKNEVERRSIKIGSVDDSGVTIIEGISGQEAVMLSAGPFLNPGQKVSPKRQAAR